MINHNFPHLNLNGNSKGIQVLPFETNHKNNVVSFDSDLKKFIVTAYREYTHKAIKATSKLTGGHFTLHSKENMPIANHYLISQNQECNDKVYNNLPFFILKFTYTTLNELSNIDIDFSVFQNEIAKLISYSDFPGIRGNRGVFVTNFRVVPHTPNHFECYIFISRAVFFNDYRVTVNFPANPSDYEATVISFVKKVEIIFNMNLYSDDIVKVSLETP